MLEREWGSEGERRLQAGGEEGGLWSPLFAGLAGATRGEKGSLEPLFEGCRIAGLWPELRGEGAKAPQRSPSGWLVKHANLPEERLQVAGLAGGPPGTRGRLLQVAGACGRNSGERSL